MATASKLSDVVTIISINAADQLMGTPYNLLANNCEDFVLTVPDLNEGSPQRVFWGAAVCFVAVACTLTRHRIA